jgi:large subunit ribosomal protein L13
MNKNKTFAPNADKIKKSWHFMDATDKVLGRFATEIAKILMGKNKAEFTPNTNVGDKVVITNVEKIQVTGKKMTDKLYIHHTGFPGGLRSETLEHFKERRPEQILKRAIVGMLPKNKLRAERIKNLYIYKGSEHPHKAQEVK